MDQSINSIKRTIKDLTPSVLEKFGLLASIQEMCETINNSEEINIVFNTNKKNLNLSIKTELALYRIIQEIINNALKHAMAKEIKVIFRSVNGLLKLSIEDDGRGFDPNSLNNENGLGLKNIESRIYLINGKYTLHTSPSGGTKYIIEVPANKTPTSHG